MAIKKLLFLHYGDSPNRGSEKVLLGTLSKLDKNRFEAVLVCNIELLAAQAETLGVKTHMFEWPEVMIDSGYVRLQFVKLLIAIVRLRRIIKKESADLVVSNCGLANQAGLYAARLVSIPVIVYIHAPYTKRYIYLYGLNRTDKAVFVSNAIRNIMVGKACFSDEVVIHNGVDTEKFYPVTKRNRDVLEKLSIGKDKTIIGQVGCLVSLKGVDVLINAAQKLLAKGIDCHILFVGSGPDEAKFKTMVKDLGLSSHVTFYGNTDTPEYFYQNIFDINVLASRSEAFGLTLAEGSACGLPCVGADTGGIPEVIRDNETGLLFAPGNAKDLADKLELLISNSSLRNEMGEKGREFVAENLSLGKQVDRFSGVLMGESLL